MLKVALRKLKQLTAEPVPFDPATIDDPLAARTEWTPLKSGGASFRTHRLTEVDGWKMEFRASKGTLAFCGVFTGFGLLAVGISIGAAQGAARLPPLLFGTLFAAIGGVMGYFLAAPFVFDKRRGECWRGRTPPHERSTRPDPSKTLRIADVHALQLVSEHVRGNKSSYFSYELNLVFDDATRVNVVDHGDREQLVKDAETLGRFLGKPVWNGLMHGG